MYLHLMKMDAKWKRKFMFTHQCFLQLYLSPTLFKRSQEKCIRYKYVLRDKQLLTSLSSNLLKTKIEQTIHGTDNSIFSSCGGGGLQESQLIFDLPTNGT